MYSVFRRLILYVEFLSIFMFKRRSILKIFNMCIFLCTQKLLESLSNIERFAVRSVFFSFLTAKHWVQSKFLESKLKHFLFFAELLLPRSSIMVSIGLLQCSTYLSKCRVSFPFGRKNKKKKRTCSWTSEFSKRFVSHYSILGFASMCFNFTKWKVYVICKLLSTSWSLEN